MSTRKGVVVNMDDLLDEAIVRARLEVDKRREDLTDDKKNKIAEAVGIGAVRFDIIRVAPEKSITFKWEQALDFEKQGAPFIQYSHARACSILEKAPAPAQADFSLLKEKEEAALVKKMAMLPYVVRNAATELKPHYVATYARELAESFNQFYRFVPVLVQSPGSARHGLPWSMRDASRWPRPWKCWASKPSRKCKHWTRRARRPRRIMRAGTSRMPPSAEATRCPTRPPRGRACAERLTIARGY